MAEALAEAAPTELAASDAPLIAETPVPACEVCGESDAAEFAAGYDYETQTCRNRWRFVRCNSCGHVWLDPRPAVEALGTIYPPTYYAYHYEELPKVVLKGKALLDWFTMRKILRWSDGLPSAYLDVGCGADARYLETLARRGVPRSALYGLEIEEELVERLRERGLQVLCKRVEECDEFEPNTFDLMTMFHVIEHVDSPRATLERMADWLAPGGVLALETPNIDSLDARLFRSGKWGGYHIPRHWHLFAPDTMRRLLESVGLEVEAVRYQTGHAFWLYSFHHALRYRSRPRPRLARLFNPFETLLPLLVAVVGFDRMRATLGFKTSAMLLIARKPR